MRRALVALLEAADRLVDWFAYRPAVVRLFLFLPRWWACDLVRRSVRLDERWGTGYWTDESWWPGPLCEACGRRTAWAYVGGLDDDEEPYGQYLDTRRIDPCLSCDIGPTEVLKSEPDVQAALKRARTSSVSWRWSRPTRRGP